MVPATAPADGQTGDIQAKKMTTAGAAAERVIMAEEEGGEEGGMGTDVVVGMAVGHGEKRAVIDDGEGLKGAG